MFIKCDIYYNIVNATKKCIFSKIANSDSHVIDTVARWIGERKYCKSGPLTFRIFKPSAEALGLLTTVKCHGYILLYCGVHVLITPGRRALYKSYPSL